MGFIFHINEDFRKPSTLTKKQWDKLYKKTEDKIKALQEISRKTEQGIDEIFKEIFKDIE